MLFFIPFSVLMGVDAADAAGVNLWPGMKTGTPLSDAEFFAALNLDLEGLEKVKGWVAAGDWKEARGEFYHYLRDRFRRARYYAPPSFITDSWWVEQGRKRHGLEDPLKALESVADDLALKGQIIFHSTGRTYQFDPAKPFDFLDFDPTGREYHEPMQLYAFYDLDLLRLAYFLTEKPAYRDRAQEMVASYCHWFSGGASGPVAAASEGNVLNPWDNWTVPRRFWGLVKFLTFLQKTDLEPDLVVEVMKVLLEDERLHVSRGSRWGGNWRQFMCSDGAAMAAMFFEFKEAQGWFDDQVQRLLTGSSDLMPDGSMSDLSTSYTDGYVIWMRTLFDLIRDFQSPLRIEVPDAIAERYERTLDWQLAMRKPDGRAVSFNDDGSHLPSSYYGRLAGDLFDYFGREDLRWFATAGKEGHPPGRASFPPTSTTPAYAGMYAMRSDWSDQARYLVVDFGPSGSHAHPDYGSFILHAYGADLIDEGGCAAYGSEPCARYSRQPWAHNIVGIDGVTQPPDRPPWGEPLANWITNAAFDYAWGRSDFGKADEERLPGVLHRRGIYFARPDYFLLLDALEGAGTHRIRSKLQLAWDVSAEVQGTTVEAHSERGASIRIVPFDHRSAPTIVTAQKEPFWDGWMSKITHTSEVEPAPAVVYEEDRELPLYYETLLYPVAPGKTLKIETQQWAAAGGLGQGVLLTVLSSESPCRDEFMVNHGQERLNFPDRGLSADGRLVHLRYQEQRLARIAFIGTAQISLPLGGKPTTIRFETPTDGYIELSREGTLRGGKAYLDLSNRRESGRLVTEGTGEEPFQFNLEVGREAIL